MAFLELILLLLVSLYACLIIWIVYQWQRIAVTASTEKPAEQFFSVIIPIRNEEGNINNLVDSILNQNYPKANFEIIIVDDHSTDNGLEALQAAPNLSILQLKDFPNTANKKKAIELAVNAARYSKVITTDGDCLWSENVLKTLDQKIVDSQADVICGLVNVKKESGLLNNFEIMDMAGMMLVTAAGIKSQLYHLANGAFLYFSKSDFIDLKPFQNNANIASGDDVFLVDTFKTRGKKIDFLRSKEAIVQTHGNTEFNQFIQQRKRWSGKSLHIASTNLNIASGIPFLSSTSWFILMMVFFTQGAAFGFTLASSIFILSDFLLLRVAKKGIGIDISYWKVPILSLLHKFYILFVGIYALCFAKPTNRW